MKHNEQIIGDRISLRPLEIKDLSSFLEYHSNPDVAEYQGFTPFSELDALQFIKQYKDKLFGSEGWTQQGIILNKTEELIGDLGLNIKDEDYRLGEIRWHPEPQSSVFSPDASGTYKSPIRYLLYT